MLCQIQSVSTGRRVTQAASKFTLGFWFKSIHAFNSLFYSSCSPQVWDSLFGKIIYSRQAHTTTEANFTCPLGHQTSIFTCPRSTLYLPRVVEPGFFPALYVISLFKSFNCIISKCGHLSLHMKNTEVLCYRLRFSHEFVTQHCLLLIIRDSKWNEQIMLIKARMLQRASIL